MYRLKNLNLNPVDGDADAPLNPTFLCMHFIFVQWKLILYFIAHRHGNMVGMVKWWKGLLKKIKSV
jgi:hypothetical protein